MPRNKNHSPPNHGKNFRIESGYTLQEVAFLLDIRNFGRVSEWENGLSNPGIEHFITLGLIYQCPTDQIYYELRKKLSAKLQERKKLLREIKERGKRMDSS